METEFSKYEPIFGVWKITRLIGEGSYGKVFEIEREDFGTVYKAALKTITIPRSKSEIDSIMADGMDEESASTYFREIIEEMTKEFALMDRLKGNSNIVSYEDHLVIEHKDEIGWDVLIRMELLTPLIQYLKQNTLAKNDVAKLGLDLCKALEVCEQCNIIHRDIKLENIFISDLGNYKLGDFGIARIADKTTGASTKIGTNSYMAPEVMRGENYDKRVDIYSLGLVLYRLLNRNRLPFFPPAPAPISFFQREEANSKRLSGAEFPAPSESDERLTDIIMKATAFNPTNRYSSASEMKADLEKYLAIGSENESLITEPFTNPVIPAQNESVISDVQEEYEKTVVAPTPVLNPTEESIPDKPRKKLGHNKLFAAGIIVLLLVCLAGSFLFGRGLNSSDVSPIDSDKISNEVTNEATNEITKEVIDEIDTASTALSSNESFAQADVTDGQNDNSSCYINEELGIQFLLPSEDWWFKTDLSGDPSVLMWAENSNGYSVCFEITEVDAETPEQAIDNNIEVLEEGGYMAYKEPFIFMGESMTSEVYYIGEALGRLLYIFKNGKKYSLAISADTDISSADSLFSYFIPYHQ